MPRTRALVVAVVAVVAAGCARPVPPTPARPAAPRRPVSPAPGTWAWENPSPVGVGIADLAIDGAAVRAVGQRGTALRSDDDGRTWTPDPTGTVEDLVAVAAHDDVVIAVGAGGAVLRSRAGGAYERLPGLAPHPLVDVAFAPDGSIVAIDSAAAVLRSTDGGATFVVESPGLDPGPYAMSVAAGADGVVMVGTAEGVWRSTGGGAHLARVPAVTEAIKRVVLDGSTWYAVAATSVVYPSVDVCNSCVDVQYDALALYRSTDDGATWQRRALVDPAAAAASGWGPASWIGPPHSPPPAYAQMTYRAVGSPTTRLYFGDVGAAVGPRGEIYVAWGYAADPTVLVSTDHATRFRTVRGGGGGALAVSPAGTVIAGGPGGMRARSIDHGAHWSPLTRAAIADKNLYQVRTTPHGVAFASGMDGAIVVRSRASQTWQLVTTGTDAYLYGLYVADDQRVVAVGTGGTIVASDDGGATFTVRASGTSETLYTVWGIGSEVYAAGGDGSVLRSDDAGQTWRAMPALVHDAGTVLWGSSLDDIWLLTMNGQQLRSVDHGATWTDVGAGLDGVITGVWGSGPDDVYLVGWGGKIHHTSDGGATWTARDSGTTADLNAIWGRGADDIYIAAGGRYEPGTLLHSTDRGHTWVAEGTPLAGPIATVGGGPDVFVVGEGARIIRRR